MSTILPRATRDAFPFQSRFLDVEGGHSCHYIDEGAGDTVVMLHGNPTWSFYYRRMIAALAQDHRVIALDHIGCGLSARPSDAAYPYTLERRVHDVTEVLDRLKVSGRVTLMLHDWGGMIGMGYATRHPERIARLVLLNTAAFPLPPGRSLPLSLHACRTPWLGPLLVRGLNAFSRAAVLRCVARRPLDDAARAGYLAPYASWADRRAVLRFVEDIPLNDRHPSWNEVQRVDKSLTLFRDTPTLILWGARDFVFNEPFLQGWRDRLPKAEVHRYDDAGHFVLDDAWEQAVPTVKDFLARSTHVVS